MKRRATVHEHRQEWIRRQRDESDSARGGQPPQDRSSRQDRDDADSGRDRRAA
ncbi:hypothetical protein [Sinomonas atrocyanea]